MAGVPPGVHAGGGATGVRVRRRGPRLRSRGRRVPRLPGALPAARARGDGGDARSARSPVRRAVRPALQRLHPRRQHGDPAEVHVARRDGGALRPDLRRGHADLSQHVLVLRPAGHEGPRSGEIDSESLRHLDFELLLRARLVHAALPALDDGPQAVPRPGDRLAHRRRGPRHPHRGLPRHRRELPQGRAPGARRRARPGVTAWTIRSSRRRSSTREAKSG